jgi:hypothetical protein
MEKPPLKKAQERAVQILDQVRTTGKAYKISSDDFIVHATKLTKAQKEWANNQNGGYQPDIDFTKSEFWWLGEGLSAITSDNLAYMILNKYRHEIGEQPQPVLDYLEQFQFSEEEKKQHLKNCLHDLYAYLREGQHLGGFLEAVVCNDLKETFRLADDINSEFIREYVKELYQNAPMQAWGSREKYQEWLAKKAKERAERN